MVVILGLWVFFKKKHKNGTTDVICGSIGLVRRQKMIFSSHDVRTIARVRKVEA